MTDDATIFAPASAPGRAGVAVIRISGARADEALRTLCLGQSLPGPRIASVRDLKDPTTKELLDRALALRFKAPHSFTGEDVVELHVHGGKSVLSGVLKALSRMPHFRFAEPGEFTRRAFENGKMDLTEAEAVADLVHAETEAQKRQALRQLDGALGRIYEGWHQRLARSLAYFEAAIDFSDEELPPDLVETQNTLLSALRLEIGLHLNDNNRGERLRDGILIAIVGLPNVGKSSLLNALSQREAAIVSPHAGTTRDVIEVYLDLGGYPVILADTAGLRESSDAIESEGITRARAKALKADIKLIVKDGSDPSASDDTTEPLIDDRAVIVINKADLMEESTFRDQGHVLISSKTGEGFELLKQKIIERLEELMGSSQSNAAPPLTRARHRAALEECSIRLESAVNASSADLRAEDVRLAMRALGKITGHVDVENLLDIIFRDFCIGK